MAETATWSPFGDQARRQPFENAAVRLEAMTPPALAIAQGDLDAPAVAGLLDAMTDAHATRLGPDLCYLWGAAEPIRRLTGQAPRDRVSVVDVSETRAWLRLSGTGAPMLLQKFSTREFSEEAFSASGALTGLGPITAFVTRTDRNDFQIAGPTSSAEYLASMLLAAAADFSTA